MSALEPLRCVSCQATGVRLDLDVKATPPVLRCLKCLRRPECDRCHKRVNRVVLQIPISRTPNGAPVFFRDWKALCCRCDR